MKDKNFGGALGLSYETVWIKEFFFTMYTLFCVKRLNLLLWCMNTWTCIDLRAHMCAQFSVLILIQEWDCIPWVALQLFSCLLTVLNKWSESPLLTGGWSETACACVWICVCSCVHGPSPAPQVSLGFLVTLCLGGERAGDNWTLPGTFNKCIERRNRKTC